MKAFTVKSLGALQLKNISVGNSKFSKNICCRLESKSEKLSLEHVMMGEYLSYLFKLQLANGPPKTLCLCLNSLSQPLGVKEEEMEMWGP